MQDEHQDACTCFRCNPVRPRLVSSHDLVRRAVAKQIPNTFGLVTEPNPALQAALEAADARLAPFRTDALRNGG